MIRPGAFLRDNAGFLAAGGIVSFTSSYGQTFFISIFAAQIMTAFALSDGAWGLIYGVATTASAATMLWAGALTDRFRVRTLALVTIPALAVVCVAMSFVAGVVGLAVVVFALRLLGQGMMSHLAVVAMARWFVARRGLALSIAALGFAVGQAVFPPVFAALLEHVDWRTLWVLAAVLVLAALPPLLVLLSAERTPGSFAAEAASAGMDGRHWRRREALGSPVFWLLLPCLIGPPAWGTALFFQQVHIAEAKGWPLVDYLSLVPLLTAVSVATTLAAGQAIDRFGPLRVATLYLLPYAAGFALLWQAGTLGGAALAFVFFGMATGMQAALPAALLATLYGTRHIGAIKAVSASVMVLGSAIGPAVSGALIDAGLSFPEQGALISLSFLASAALVLAAVARAAPRLASSGEIDVKRA